MASERMRLYGTVRRLRCVACDKKAIPTQVYHDRITYCLDCYCRNKEPDSYLLWLRCKDCTKCGKKIPKYLDMCFSCTDPIVVDGMKNCTTCKSLFSVSDTRSECGMCIIEHNIEKLLAAPRIRQLCPNLECNNNVWLEKWESECKECRRERKYYMKYLDDD